MPEQIRVLVVDDEPAVGELAVELLEEAGDRLSVTAATSVERGLEVLGTGDFDCVVSDYEMPGRDGLAFLEAVREDHGDLPFILFTAKGSEAVASDAISAGATDYLQKGSGLDRYELLANRVANAVEQRRANERARETQRQLQSLAENSNDVLWMFDADWSELRFINAAYEVIWGRQVEELREQPRSFLEGIHPDDRPKVREAMGTLSSGEPVDIEYRVNDAEDYGRWVWVQGMPVTGTDGSVEGVAGFARDVTDWKAREAELEATNDQLRELQRQFELTLEATDTYAWRWDLDDDTVERTPAVGTVFDVDAASLESIEDFFELVHPDHRDQLREALDALRSDGASYHVRYRLRTGDGWVWVEERGDWLDERTAIGLVSDITARRERELALERERDRLSTLFENFPEPAVEYEFVGGEPVVRAANEAFFETFQYGPDAAIDTPLNDLVVPLSRRSSAERLDEQVRAGERLDVEVRRRTADGIRDFRIRNIATPDLDRSDGYAIYTDITERRDRERRLDRLRDRIQDLLYARTRTEAAGIATEAARDVIGAPLSGFHLLNGAGDALEPAGTIETAGEANEEPPTYDRGAEAGTRSAVVWEVFESGEPVWIEDTERYEPLEQPARTRSVIVSPVEDHGVFILGDPQPNAFDETEESLTEILTTFARTALDRLEREAALRSREEQLEHQNERLEEFASVLSHDLRNPLNVLMGSLELAEETGSEEAFGRSQRAVDRMAQLIDDMLALARAGHTVAELEPVELNELVDACWSTVETADAELHNQASSSIAADPSRLRQLLENLVANAVEHGGADVTVTIGDLEDGFYVEDDGSGIPAEHRQELFDSGFTTVEDGTGFGLAIVEQIASAHGWSVDVTVGMAGGARFEITGVDRLA